jgi:membrane protein DedA with SNARE-associated domain
VNVDTFVAGALIGGAVWGAVVVISSVVLGAWRERQFWAHQAEVVVFDAGDPGRN